MSVSDLPNLPADEDNRRDILNEPMDTRAKFAASFINDAVIQQWRNLQKWRDITNQTAQFDSGYYGQHLASIVSGIAGTARRGKGLDMREGSEVKTASVLDGEDNPRWNHMPLTEEKSRELVQSPNIFYILMDWNDVEELRVRLWRVSPTEDDDFCQLVSKWLNEDYDSKNFQLHPPVSRDCNVARKSIGTLELPLMFHLTHDLEDTVKIHTANDEPGMSQLLQQYIDDY